MVKCLVCPSNDAVVELRPAGARDVRCPQCVQYHVTFSAVDSLMELDNQVKPSVSRWIHDQCDPTARLRARRLRTVRPSSR
jgi:hypothetical protein